MPGGVLAVSDCRGNDPEFVAFGSLTYEDGSPPVEHDTIYDIASLTKLLTTTAVAMTLVADGSLDLDTEVAAFIPEWLEGQAAHVTVGHLLAHTGGLEAHQPFYLDQRSSEEVLGASLRTQLVYEPGTAYIYSDLGIIILAAFFERLTGACLADLVRDRVLSPLHLTDTLFNPPSALYERIAPTEVDTWRGRLLRGEVHDENAYAMGGIAPHAGLFSTAENMIRFGRSLLPNGSPAESLVPAHVVERFVNACPVPGSPWAYGVRRFGDDPHFGSYLSPSAYGGTGFTGTLLVVDPERELTIVLLTNRVHPTRENQGIFAARGLILDAVLREFDRDHA